MSILEEQKKLQQLREQCYDQERAVQKAILDELAEKTGLDFADDSESYFSLEDDLYPYIAQSPTGEVLVVFTSDGSLLDFDDRSKGYFYEEIIKKLFF
jgi:hypothetical protein